MKIPSQLAKALFFIARQSIEYFFETKQVLPYERVKLSDEQKQLIVGTSAAFVALYTGSDKVHPRGINGVFESFEPLGKLVGQLAVNAAFYDPRAPRLKPYELNVLDIHIVLPGVRCKIIGDLADVAETIQQQRQGVIAETQGRIAYALPHEWSDNMSGMQMIRWLKLQLGVSRKSKHPVEFSAFTVTEYAESY